MMLTPTEQERLTIFAAAELARRHRSLGIKLSHPEAVAYICEKLPLHEAMRVTGHKMPATLLKYYHAKDGELAQKLG